MADWIYRGEATPYVDTNVLGAPAQAAAAGDVLTRPGFAAHPHFVSAHAHPWRRAADGLMLDRAGTKPLPELPLTRVIRSPNGAASRSYVGRAAWLLARTPGTLGGIFRAWRAGRTTRRPRRRTAAPGEAPGYDPAMDPEPEPQLALHSGAVAGILR